MLPEAEAVERSPRVVTTTLIRVHPWFNFGVRVCAGEAECHAGASPAGRIGLFTTETCVREEAVGGVEQAGAWHWAMTTAVVSPSARTRLLCKMRASTRPAMRR